MPLAAMHARHYTDAAYAATWDRVLARVRGARPAKDADADPHARAAEAPEISVVICTHDRHHLLDHAIGSVLEQSLSADRYEIIVVDNSPDQAAAARHAERHRDERVRGARVRYELEPKPGLSNARNVGAGLARGGIVAFIDDDATANRTWLAALLDGYAAFPAAGAVGGRVVPLWAGARPPWLHDDLLTYLSAVDWGGRTRVLRPGEWLAGTNVSFRRQELIECGGFSLGLGRRGSDRVLLSNEEIEVMDRLAARGLSGVYAPEACVEHRIDSARLTPAWLRRRIAWQAVSDCFAGARASKLPVSAFAERLSRFIDNHDGARPGFFTATDDANRFREDVRIVYDLVMALLAGGIDLDAVPRNRTARMRARLARWLGRGR